MITDRKYPLIMIVKLIACATIILFIYSCAHLARTAYLDKAVNRADQDEVMMQLGPPHRTNKLSSGDEVWAYDYHSLSIVGSSAGSAGSVAGSSKCRLYILRFDENKILRQWTYQRC